MASRPERLPHVSESRTSPRTDAPGGTDQAESLRQLVRRQSLADADAHRGIVVLTSCHPREGVTYVCLNVALTLQRSGCPTVIVDLSEGEGGVLDACGVQARYHLDDAACGHRSIREVQQMGPCGLSMVRGTRESFDVGYVNSLRQLARHRLVLIDLGHRPPEDPWLRAADLVVVVTTTAAEETLRTYGWLKTLASQGTGAQLGCIANRVQSPVEGRSAVARLVVSCDRFLNLQLLPLGTISRETGHASGLPYPAVSLLRAGQRNGEEALLRQAASRLVACLPDSDLVCRTMVEKRNVNSEVEENTKPLPTDQPMPGLSLIAPPTGKM